MSWILFILTKIKNCRQGIKPLQVTDAWEKHYLCNNNVIARNKTMTYCFERGTLQWQSIFGQSSFIKLFYTVYSWPHSLLEWQQQRAIHTKSTGPWSCNRLGLCTQQLCHLYDCDSHKQIKKQKNKNSTTTAQKCLNPPFWKDAQPTSTTFYQPWRNDHRNEKHFY